MMFILFVLIICLVVLVGTFFFITEMRAIKFNFDWKKLRDLRKECRKLRQQLEILEQQDELERLEKLCAAYKEQITLSNSEKE